MCGVTMCGVIAALPADWTKPRYFNNRAAVYEPSVVVYGAGTLTCSVWMPPLWQPPTPEPEE